MDTVMTQRIVVGVDGSRASRNALLWAAREARIRQSQLVITHIDPPSPEGVSLYGDPLGSEAILESSADVASHREPSVVVATLLLHGAVPDELIKVTRPASMLVVGVDRSKSRAAHGVLGPVEDRVVVHASCPVVAVPSSSVVATHPEPGVVVLWTDDGAGPPAVGAAAEAAAAHGACLTVVTALPEEATAAMNLAVADVRYLHPSLIVRTVAAEDACSAVLREAQGSALLVNGCPHDADRWSIRLGPVVGRLMHEAPSPVMFVGPGSARTSIDADVVRRAS